MATSSDAAHRGQRWPGLTFACFPNRSTVAGTVWVQIGQNAEPLSPFSMSAFISASHHIGRKNQRRGFHNLRIFSIRAICVTMAL